MSRLSYLAGSQPRADLDPGHRAAPRVAVMLRRFAASPLALGRMAIRRVVRWRVRRKAIEALSGLDERLLRDIGLFPGDIDSVVDGLIDQSRAEKAANANRGRLRSERAGTPVPMGCG